MRVTVAALFIACAAVAAQEIPYPKVETSYRAQGSINVEQDGITTNTHVLMSFDESFQLSTSKLAVTLFENGDNRTIIEQIREKKPLIYSKTGCQSLPENDYRMEAGLRLLKAESTGQYIFTVNELLNLNVEDLKSNVPVNDVWRTIPVRKWTFFFNDSTSKIEIDAYWATNTTVSSSKSWQVPVSFKIQSSLWDEISEKWRETKQIVEVNSFTHGEINYSAFRPRRGVFCKGRQNANHFPELIIQKLKTLPTKVENVVKQYSETGVFDTWFDPDNKLYKINYAPSVNNIKKGVQRIISHVQGVVYEIQASQECAVRAVKDIKDPFEPETIFNPLDEGNFNMKSFFGTNQVNYVNIGETVERGVPCVLYQGERTDWPPNIEKPITTVWEWCLANQVEPEVKLQLNGFPLVSLNIYVTESNFSVDQSLYVKGLRLAYNFYDVRNHTQEYLDNLAFDIRECFADSNQKRLFFKAAVVDKVKKLISENIRQLDHVAAWKAAICKAATIHPGSLRISDVQTRLVEDELEVSFTLLGQHPDLPDPSTEVSLDTALTNLKTAVDEGQLAVEVKLGSETNAEVVNLKGEPGSLRARKVVVDGGEETESGISGGTMAAVAVVMLALGLAVGAAIIFVKRRKHYQKL